VVKFCTKVLAVLKKRRQSKNFQFLGVVTTAVNIAAGIILLKYDAINDSGHLWVEFLKK